MLFSPLFSFKTIYSVPSKVQELILVPPVTFEADVEKRNK